ncbi:MAG: tetratricopeptide repeat protein, partial [Lysobacterales bacterium]
MTVQRSGMFLLLLPLTIMADYQSGLDAYDSGDYATALHDWKAVVTPTHPAIFAETHYAIGMLYWTGQGVTKDYFEASKWMHQGAHLNHAGAQAKLGYLYTEGIAVKQDYQQAFEWFSKA